MSSQAKVTRSPLSDQYTYLYEQTHQYLDRDTTNLTRIDLYPSHEISALPIKIPNAPLALNTEQNATRQSLCLKAHIQPAPLFLKVSKDFDAKGRLPYRIIITIILRTTRKVQRLPKRLVAPRQRRVDDVLAITAHRNEAAIPRV